MSDVLHTFKSPPAEKPPVVEERKGFIRFVVAQNDNTPQNMIVLTGLKCLFQRQLPKMPREYIARLVYDRNSEGLAIVRHGLQVVGGITYRPFPHRGFAEIVFFAIASRFQTNVRGVIYLLSWDVVIDQLHAKGYGGHLMNHFKMNIRARYPTIEHFMTYADNYAIGYFKKQVSNVFSLLCTRCNFSTLSSGFSSQGFTKEITLPRPVWVGYIKDYEGGTLMQVRPLGCLVISLKGTGALCELCLASVPSSRK